MSKMLRLLKNKEGQESKCFLFVLAFISYILYYFVALGISDWMINTKGYDPLIREATLLPLPISYYAFLVVLVFPTIEELIFRLPLRVTAFNLSVALLTGCWFFLFRSEIFDFSFPDGNIAAVKLVLGFAFSVTLLLSYRKNYIHKLVDLWSPSNTMYLLIASAFFFMIYHLGKMNTTSSYYSGLFMLVAYFVPGIFYGYVRIRLNLMCTLFFHMLNNSIPYLILLYYSIKTRHDLLEYI